MSTACCNKGDTASIPSETVRAAGADAENPAADPDAKASEDGESGRSGRSGRSGSHSQTEGHEIFGPFGGSLTKPVG